MKEKTKRILAPIMPIINGISNEQALFLYCVLLSDAIARANDDDMLAKLDFGYKVKITVSSEDINESFVIDNAGDYIAFNDRVFDDVVEIDADEICPDR